MLSVIRARVIFSLIHQFCLFDSTRIQCTPFLSWNICLTALQQMLGGDSERHAWVIKATAADPPGLPKPKHGARNLYRHWQYSFVATFGLYYLWRY